MHIIGKILEENLMFFNINLLLVLIGKLLILLQNILKGVLIHLTV
jgi:hypothetical protein